MAKREKSEVQNLTNVTVAGEALDASPPASDTRHVAQGEPKAFDGESVAVDDVRDGEGYPTEEGRLGREG